MILNSPSKPLPTNSFDLLTLQDLNFMLICYITTIISSRAEFGFIPIVQIEGSTDSKNALGGGRLGTFFLPLLLRHFLGRTLESGRRYVIFGTAHLTGNYHRSPQ